MPPPNFSEIFLNQQISPMHSQRCYVSVVELDGLIYALGGYDGKNRLKSAERYDPATNQWTLITSMNYLRSDAHACTLYGKIYVTGKPRFGLDWNFTLLNSQYLHRRYDRSSMPKQMRILRSADESMDKYCRHV